MRASRERGYRFDNAISIMIVEIWSVASLRNKQLESNVGATLTRNINIHKQSNGCSFQVPSRRPPAAFVETTLVGFVRHHVFVTEEQSGSWYIVQFPFATQLTPSLFGTLKRHSIHGSETTSRTRWFMACLNCLRLGVRGISGSALWPVAPSSCGAGK